MEAIRDTKSSLKWFSGSELAPSRAHRHCSVRSSGRLAASCMSSWLEAAPLLGRAQLMYRERSALHAPIASCAWQGAGLSHQGLCCDWEPLYA